MSQNDATQRQVAAARPDKSTWLTANAGSGKTRVLTDRVARLLLSGVDPRHILCLTYTKAAAGEMQNRLFRTLGAWAMMEDAELADQLQAKGIEGAADLAEARRLFARAIETPGGLKIQTIHSFCAGLLRRFPLEAGVSPDFREMDDRTGELLRREVLDQMANGEQADRQALFNFATLFTGASIDDICRAIMARHENFTDPAGPAKIAKLLGADEKTDTQKLLTSRLGDIPELLRRIMPFLEGGKPMDVRAADALRPLMDRPLDMQGFRIVCGKFLLSKAPYTAKIGKFPTKDLREKMADQMEELNDTMTQVEELRDALFAQSVFDRTMVLYDFASAFAPKVQAKMTARGLLGFDDLITRSRDLLTTPEVAAWVLWRLDGGIDHILVDEAQDTSPPQWEVIRLLAQEFAAGEGARGAAERTLFVVGDRKQSIYSFQGADPFEFDRMNSHFEERMAEAGRAMEQMSLDHSFRSSPVILDLVDRVFAGEAAEGLEANVTHVAFHEAMPGRVDLLPPIEAEPAVEEKAHWSDPVDKISPSAPELRLAIAIAAQMKHMIDHETLPVMRGGVLCRRPITEGDFLILVRRRKVLFHAILREAKKAGLKVAGKDRLQLGAELAVRDLQALLQFLSLPEDDLALATALRSPLFGWSEADLYGLAQGRKGYLWQALRAQSDHPKTLAILTDLRDRADFLRPHDLIARILIKHHGRARLLARLGLEAEEGIDALLAQSLSYEGTNVPSLTGFLGWLATEDVEVKRQQGGAGDALQIMTVHGAKGLERPIVILPETGKSRPPNPPPMLHRGGISIWRPSADTMPEGLGEMASEERHKATLENRRLLYVAMTRAEQWLIVAAAGKVGEGTDSWYAMIDGAMEGAETIEHPASGPLRRLAHGDWTPPLCAQVSPPARSPARLPPDGPVAAPAREAEPLSPSDLGGAKALPDEGASEELRELAMARGTMLHAMLEHLPKATNEAQRRAIATRLSPSDPELAALGLSLAANEQLAALLTEGRPEVTVTAQIPELGGVRLRGAIDLLVTREDLVKIIDFKSNRMVPDDPAKTPEGILRQMGAYAAICRQIWPTRDIQTAIFWTQTGEVMWLDDALTRDALMRASWS